VKWRFAGERSLAFHSAADRRLDVNRFFPTLRREAKRARA
jgi:hypothetical protein